VCVCVFACVLRCVCAPVSWPCRADRPSSHGAGSSCVLCCRSGCLSHWSVVSTVSRHSGSTKAVSLSPLCPSLISFFCFPATQSSSPSPSFVTPHFPFRLLNRLFFFYSSLFILCLLKWDCCKTQAEDITEKYAFPLFTFTIHNRQLHIASRVKASSLLLFHFRNVKVLPQLSINVCIRRQTCRLKLIR